MGRYKIQAPPEREVVKPRSMRLVLRAVLFALLCIAPICVSVCIYVFQITDKITSEIFFTCGIMALAYFGFWLSTVCRGKINIGTRAIISRERFGNLTYPMSVCYYEICDIVLVRKVGRNKSVTVYDEKIVRPCIIFDCINGDKREIDVLYYGKEQIVKILDMVLDRAAQNDNKLNYRSGQEIYDNALTPQAEG